MTLEDFNELEETLHDHVDPHCFLKEKCIECVLDAMKECVERERIKAKKLLEALEWIRKWTSEKTSFEKANGTINEYNKP